MKKLQFITFLSILGGIFFIIHYNSDNKGFLNLGFWKSFKTAILVSAIIASLISYPVGVEENEYYVINNSSRQVIVANSKGNPLISPRQFPTSPSGGRPSRPVTTPYVNPYRVPPKFVDQGLGGAGNGAGATEFDFQLPVPKNEQKPPGYISSPKKKKKQEQCELNKNERKEINGVKVDFDYRLNKKGNPVLLVPNNDPLLKGESKFMEVGNDQAKSHLHHAEDLEVQLPDTFDMAEYKSLGKRDRIQYAEKHVREETIIEYQNEIGNSMVGNIIHAPGTMTKYQKEVDLKINKSKKLLSVVDKNSQHISTYKINESKMRRMAVDNFWIWQNQK